MSGHVYVVAGDLARLECDAWLLPTDESFRISPSFAGALGVEPDTCLPGHDWAGQRVVRAQGGPLQRVWLGDVGRWRAEPSWYAGVIDPFVRAACAAVGTHAGHRRPVLAVNVLGTGEGGMDADKGAIHEALLPALYEAVRTHEVDLVLVCWGRRAYSAAQRIRRRFVEASHGGRAADLWDLGPRHDDLLAVAGRLAEQARRRNLVLFMGAGVSIGAGLPAWQGLLDEIAEVLGDDAPSRLELRKLDFRDQAMVLERRLFKVGKRLHDVVAQLTDRASYSLAHAQLASLCVREAVTTNYDRLYEAAVAAVDGDVAVLPYQPVAPEQRWLLKLHGSIDRDQSVILTRADYLTAPTRHGALFGLVQAMLLTRHMLFVGYSLSDEDFHQLVHEVRLARGRAGRASLGTVIALFDDPLFAELWDDDLDVVPLADQPAGPPTSEDYSVAARRLQILLDLIAFEAADLDAFLLDPTYDALLSPDEATLAELLRPLVDAYLETDPAPDVPAALRVRKLLEDLGGPAGSTR